MKLETPRLVIQEFTTGDFEASIHEYATDEEVYRYQHWGPNSPQDTHAFLQYAIGEQKEQPRNTYELAILLKRGQHIGGVRLGIQSRVSAVADIGYTLRRDCWGQGYGTEAARAILEFGFQELGLHRIWATVDPENAGSQRVLEKCGMKREGLLRENLLVRGKWRDQFLYAILSKEFT